jgi:SNARE domain
MTYSKKPKKVSKRSARASKEYKHGKTLTSVISFPLLLFPTQTHIPSQPSQKYTVQKLSREFSAAGQEFQVIQRRALEKDRASKSALEDSAASATTTSPTTESRSQSQSQQQLQQQSPRLASQTEVDFQEHLIIERESEIRNIEQGVSELNELFRDVATIVREQGDAIDAIDLNVENVRNDTRGAQVELTQASRYQKSARNKACCLLVIMAVVLLVIVLAVVLG